MDQYLCVRWLQLQLGSSWLAALRWIELCLQLLKYLRAVQSMGMLLPQATAHLMKSILTTLAGHDLLEHLSGILFQPCQSSS